MTMIRLSLLIVFATAAGCAGPAGPETVIVNAKVFTSNAAQPWAQALAIRGDRIIAVGDTATITALAGSATRRIDAGGRTIVPGFNDAHQHIGLAPPNDRLTMPFDPTLDQIATALRAQVKTSPAGRLIQGEFGESAWEDPSFTRAWLDAIAPNHPVRLFAFTGHGQVLNSRALALIGIGEQVQDPEGGRYGHDASGRLDGRLEEYADYVAARRFGVTTDPAEAVEVYRRFATEARGFGITSVQLIADPLPIETLSKYLVDANVPIRWRTYRFPIREAGGDTTDSRPPTPPQPTPLIDTRGMKWIIDGTPIERLGFMRDPYTDAPGQRGRLSFSQERIDQFVGWAYSTEDPLAVHAVGDGAIEAYVSAVEKAGRAEVWRAKRPRIEHGDLMRPDLIPRVKAMGMVVVQNPTHFTFPELFLARLGKERLAWAQPMKALLANGIPLAIGSDGPMNPFLNIMAASTHPTNPKEALTREQAVSAYTAGSAFAEFQEKDKGQLAVGMLADLAVLSADLFTVPVDQMEAIRSVMTMLGGRVVHETGVIH
jgi:predicted amidohydrolase YtcJ